MLNILDSGWRRIKKDLGEKSDCDIWCTLLCVWLGVGGCVLFVGGLFICMCVFVVGVVVVCYLLCVFLAYVCLCVYVHVYGICHSVLGFTACIYLCVYKSLYIPARLSYIHIHTYSLSLMHAYIPIPLRPGYRVCGSPCTGLYHTCFE